MDLVLARIGKPHGLHGEVTVQPHTDDPASRFGDGAVLQTSAAPGSGVPRTLTVRSTRVHNGTWLLAFEEIPDRTGAESLRGTRLVMEAGSSADEGTDATDEQGDQQDEGWYEDDLVGLRVEDVHGALVGEVEGLEIGAAQDRLLVRVAPDGDQETPYTAAIPLVEALVPLVDVEGGRVVIDPPPGLLELGR